LPQWVIDPAGNVWVANNWDMPKEGFKEVPDPAPLRRQRSRGLLRLGEACPDAAGRPARTTVMHECEAEWVNVSELVAKSIFITLICVNAQARRDIQLLDS
jgi:hypothetical protein